MRTETAPAPLAPGHPLMVLLDEYAKAYQFHDETKIDCERGWLGMDILDQAEAELDAAHAALTAELARLVADVERMREAVTGADVLRVTRFEVIDYRRGAPDPGRAFQAHGCSVTLSVQDEGRTLKVFVDDPAARAVEGATP